MTAIYVVPGTAEAVSILSRHADHASAFLAMNDETCHFTTPGIDGLIAYRPAGRRYVVQLGGPFAAPQQRLALLTAFENWAREHRRRPIAVQVLSTDIALYAERGYVANQLGASYSIDLDGYHLRGRKFVKVRNMINRARREGVSVAEVAPSALSSRINSALDDIDAAWLRSKGRHVKELAFMIGERTGRGAPYRRLFVAEHESRPIAYVSFSPVYGSQPGWLYDLTRRLPATPPGVIDAVFAAALETFQVEKARWLHLGLTPFTGLDPAHEDPAVAHRHVTRVIRLLSTHGHKIYPAASQLSFKLKWQPHTIHPEYVAFADKLHINGVFSLLRLTRTL